MGRVCVVSARMRRTLWALPFGVAAALFGLWRWAGSGEPAAVAGSTAGQTAERAILPAPPEADSQRATTVPDEGAHEPQDPLGVSALRELCGRPWEAAFSAECVAALERRYRDEVPQVNSSASNRGHFRPVLLGESITWAQVFDGTAAAVAAARQALGRDECLVPEGHIRIDLREACAADQLAKLAILRAECTWGVVGHASLESRQVRWETDMMHVHRAADSEAYQQRLERLHDSWYGRQWRLGKCRDVPDAALGALGPFPRPVGYGNIGNEQTDLMIAAARLGSDWALSSVLWWTDKMFGVDEAHFDAVAGERPVLAELLRMRRAEGAERIMHAVVSLRLGAALGVRVHRWGVLRFTGPVSVDQHRAGWRLAAPRLMALGWTLVVADPDGGPPRRYEKPAALLGDEPWVEWGWDRRVTLAPSPFP